MSKRFVVATSGVLLVALPALAWASEGAGEQPDFARMFWILAVMLVVGKLSGELSERIGQPAVLGELVAGAVLGGSLLGVIPTEAGDALTPVVSMLAEMGVVVLLFEIGLETDLRAMFRVGRGATSIAVVGVTLPMIGGILFWFSPLANHEYGLVAVGMTAVFIGATLTATSVGITARVLHDLRAMHSLESRLIIGAAVIDDIIGLILLGVVSTLVAGEAVSVLSVSKSFAVAVGFLVVAVGVGMLVAPKIFDLINRMRVRGVLLVAAFAFVLVIAALADEVGSAPIVGAFAAGLILSGTNQFELISQRIRPVADIFTPIFFLSIGAKFDVHLLNPLEPDNIPVLTMGIVLFLIAVAGKVGAGWAVPWRRYNQLAVGVGMIPRGEVGLIFANMGLAMGVLGTELFGAIIIMVIGTTFVAPPLLKWSFLRRGLTVREEEGPVLQATEASTG